MLQVKTPFEGEDNFGLFQCLEYINIFFFYFLVFDSFHRLFVIMINTLRHYDIIENLINVKEKKKNAKKKIKLF